PFVRAPQSARGARATAGQLPDRDLAAERQEVVDLEDVVVIQPDAAARRHAADRGRIRRPVDPVAALPEAEPPRPERVRGVAGREEVALRGPPLRVFDARLALELARRRRAIAPRGDSILFYGRPVKGDGQRERFAVDHRLERTLGDLELSPDADRVARE